MAEAVAAPVAESLLVDAVAPAAVDVGVGTTLAGGLGGAGTVGGLFGAGAGAGATGLGGITSLSALPATVAEVSPVAMGQITSALAPAAVGTGTTLAGYGLGGAGAGTALGTGAGLSSGLGTGSVLGAGTGLGLGTATISPEITALQQQLAASQMPQVTELGQVAANELTPEMLQQTQNQAIRQAIADNVAKTGTGAFSDTLVNNAITPDIGATGYDYSNLSRSLNPVANQVSTYASGTSDLVGGGVNAATGAPIVPGEGGGIPNLLSSAGQWMKENPLKTAAGAIGAAALLAPKPGLPEREKYSGPLSKFHYDPSKYTPQAPAQPTPYQPVYQNYRGYAGGGPVEQMANANAIGQNTGYPQSALHQGAYATPWQTPISQNVLSGPADTNVDPYTGEERFASGGISSLGRYSDGGQMLKGPGDGMSDSIPATIANKQPARLANDEFVVPADVVSHLGNGSSDAGAKQLYSMMDRVRKARTGTTKQGKQINPSKYIPA